MNFEKIDVKGKMCPIPVALTKRKLDSMKSGEMLEVVGEGDLEFENIQRWVINNAHEVVKVDKSGNEFSLLVKKH
ncbi:MAG: sulfurtransferase TusA family protein [Crenarchaeota archaeon]|jgi:tRNA 2-thiouridine synthesizing protein A|nr:sulfurtransferase TusA family protein [Thermoproteota archaeon]